MDLNSLVALINSRFKGDTPNVRSMGGERLNHGQRTDHGRPNLVLNRRDRFIPSSRLSDVASPTATPSGDEFLPSSSEPSGESATYSFLRQAKLDYKMKLAFDLDAVTMLAESYADGDLQSLEEFAAGGFGFRGDFQLSGQQMIEETAADPSAQGSRREFANESTRQRGLAAYQDRSFRAESFYREAMKTRRSLHETVRDGHRKAVNSLEMRYRLDSRFQFSFLSQFNRQTESLGAEQPDQLPQYFDNVDGLAQKASPDMMAGFFDTVQAYLDQAEEQMLSQATQAFELAAAELGFEGGAVAMTKDQLVGTIEGFFARVDQALEQVESAFVAPEPQLAPTAPVVPQPDLKELYDPSLELLKAHLASI
ncbi:MAG: hypothetical protein ABIE70_01965 [bacterium]